MKKEVTINGWCDVVSQPPPKHTALLAHTKYCAPHFKVTPCFFNGVNFITLDKVIMNSVTHYAVINKDALPEGYELESIVYDICESYENDLKRKYLTKFLEWLERHKYSRLDDGNVWCVDGAYVDPDTLIDIFINK